MSSATSGVGRIGQIALSVHDMDRAVAFYRDIVGLKFLFQAPNVAFFDVAGVRLMLGQAEPKDMQPAGTYLYFECADLDTDFATLNGRGAVVEREPHIVAKLGAKDLWMAAFRDPDGNVFHLMSER
jgi:predicted enzyme related to lactoylglutathione lyase